MPVDWKQPDNALVTSKNPCWGTPQALFDRLDAEFGFTLDVCATADNAKCSAYIPPERDGLAVPWGGVCWMNPPYGKDIGKWVHKAYESAEAGAVVVCLLPARTDTKWWHDFCMRATEIRFVQRRIRFEGARWTAPFPSAIVVFKPSQLGAARLAA